MEKKIRWHSPDKLMNALDRNGNKPGVYISLSNRGGGKTYGFSKWIFEHMVDKGILFGMYTRWASDLGHVALTALNSMLNDNYPDYTVRENVVDGVYSEIWMCLKEKNSEDVEEEPDRLIGFVFPINLADKIKQKSSMFIDVDILFMDEFQTLGKYCPDEVNKFLDIHTSIARGKGKAVRYVPIIMLSNSLSIANPYFVVLGLTTNLQDNTKFYRGNGLVLEHFINEDVREAQKADPVNIAFANADIMKTNLDNDWYFDNRTCICKPEREWGKSQYMCTLKDGKTSYAIRYYANAGFYYINYSVDSSCSTIYNLSLDGHLNLPFVQKSAVFKILKDAFYKGNLRCSDIKIKNMIVNIIA